MRTFVAFCVIVMSVWVLETARSGVEISHFKVGETPVTRYALPVANGPAVVVAHGFAGSSPMMQGYALPLAQAGYRVFVFDFLGHGQHTLPMSGDVTSVDGTTRLLVNQTKQIVNTIEAGGQPVALVGHSMASDVLVRVAAETGDAHPLVLLSAFSQEITSTAPENLLLLVGAWEPGLSDFALEAVAMVDPETEAVFRRAVVLPMIEHVSILQSAAGQVAAVDWLNASYGRSNKPTVLSTGPAIVGVLAGLVFLFVGLARYLPKIAVPSLHLSLRQTSIALGVPMLATPPLAMLLNPGLMPVLVADYLALHLLIYGAIQLGLLMFWRVPFGPISFLSMAALLLGCSLFAIALHRYAANFVPTGDRIWIIAVMALGAVAFFVANARLSHGARLRQRFAIHGAFLASLVFAVVLDFSGLFFLLMIAPVIILFFMVFGSMGRVVSNRAGPMTSGIALGLMLAWSLGVTFPLFQG